MSKLQEKPSALKREHPALQKIKFINFFLCLWVIFALLVKVQSSVPNPKVVINEVRWATIRNYKITSDPYYSSWFRTRQIFHTRTGYYFKILCSKNMKRQQQYCGDPHHVDGDPDPAFHFDADPDPAFHCHADADPVFYFDADPDPASHKWCGSEIATRVNRFTVHNITLMYLLALLRAFSCSWTHWR